MRLGARRRLRQYERFNAFPYAEAQNDEPDEDRRSGFDVRLISRIITPVDLHTAIRAQRQCVDIATTQQLHEQLLSIDRNGDGQWHCPSLTPA